MTGKRAALPRASDFTGQFLKDWERLSRSGRFDMGRLKEVMLRLVANDGALPPERRDHALQGEWKDQRECRISRPDGHISRSDIPVAYPWADAVARSDGAIR